MKEPVKYDVFSDGYRDSDGVFVGPEMIELALNSHAQLTAELAMMRERAENAEKLQAAVAVRNDEFRTANADLAEQVQSLTKERDQLAAEAARWRFMMAAADNPEGQESKAINAMLHNEADDRKPSVQAAEALDSAIAALTAVGAA